MNRGSTAGGLLLLSSTPAILSSETQAHHRRLSFQEEIALRDLIHTFSSSYSRRRITQSIFFKLGMGCLGLVFIAICLGILLLVNFMP
jgi:hypothetical protein